MNKDRKDRGACTSCNFAETRECRDAMLIGAPLLGIDIKNPVGYPYTTESTRSKIAKIDTLLAGNCQKPDDLETLRSLLVDLHNKTYTRDQIE